MGFIARVKNRWNARRVGRVYLYVFEQACKAAFKTHDDGLYEWYRGALGIIVEPVNKYWREYQQL